MTPYLSLGRDSSIVAYDFEPNAIVVLFNDGMAYHYPATRAGAVTIAEMKALATAGRGLCSFIHAHVKDKYDRKWRMHNG